MSESETQIHPTAVVDPRARIGRGCVIGPCAVIDGDVELGDECHVGPGVYITGRTQLGARNRLHAGAVLGDAPQDLKYAGAPTGLRIGTGNIFREHATIHRSNKMEEDTVIGDGNLFMAHSHAGHNSAIGNNNIIANGALIAGHVAIADKVFVSGNCVIHQFCRIGRLAMMQGGSAISKDLPPFCVARGDNGVCGLNTIGLRRAGIDSQSRLELRGLYRLLFRRSGKMSAAIQAARAKFSSLVCVEFLDFAESTRRGLCADTLALGPRSGASEPGADGAESD